MLVQIITCGYGQYLFKSLLMCISCEDIGFGCAEAPRLVRDQFARWRKALQRRKLKSSEAYKCEEGMMICIASTEQKTFQLSKYYLLSLCCINDQWRAKSETEKLLSPSHQRRDERLLRVRDGANQMIPFWPHPFCNRDIFPMKWGSFWNLRLLNSY